MLDLARVVLRAPALFAGPSLPPAELADAAEAAGAELLWGERRGGEVALVSRMPIGEREARLLACRLGADGLVHHALEDLAGALAGLDDEDLDTLGLGVVAAIDFAGATMTVETAVDPARIASVSVGRERHRRS